MQVLRFATLPEAAVEIRREVFVKEQGFQSEFDKVDEIATHFLLVEEGVPQATCRVYFNAEKSAYIVGRVAVKKQSRGKNLGKSLIDAAADLVKEKGGDNLVVHAQTRAQAFYERVGFVPFGEMDEDEGRPHIWMQKCL